jgi:hypothetical protein
MPCPNSLALSATGGAIIYTVVPAQGAELVRFAVFPLHALLTYGGHAVRGLLADVQLARPIILAIAFHLGSRGATEAVRGSDDQGRARQRLCHESGRAHGPASARAPSVAGAALDAEAPKTKALRRCEAPLWGEGARASKRMADVKSSLAGRACLESLTVSRSGR